MTKSSNKINATIIKQSTHSQSNNQNQTPISAYYTKQKQPSLAKTPTHEILLSPDNTIEVTIHGEQFDALVDTGSNSTILGRDILEIFPQFLESHKPIKKGPTGGVTANGAHMPFIGKITIPITIENTTYEIPCFVCPEMTTPIILGNDFLRATKAEIDFNKTIMKISHKNAIMAATNLKIPPKTQFTVSGKLTKGEYKEGLGLIQCNNELDSKGALVANTLVVLKNEPNHLIQVCGINISTEEIKIKEGDIVATVSEIQQDTNIVPLLPPKNSVTAINSVYNKQNPCDDRVPTDEFIQLFKFDESEIDKDQKETLIRFLWKNRKVFKLPGERLGHTDIYEHVIYPKPDIKPWKARPYRANPVLRKEIDRQIKQMLEDEIIEPSMSPFTSPVVLVQKPDKTFRLVIDFRKANQHLYAQTWPINHMEDELQSLGASKSRLFTTADLQQGYYQIKLEESSRPYTGFVAGNACYQFCRSPMGLNSSSQAFSRMMSLCLSGILWTCCSVFLDDLLVYSNNFEQHLERLQLVFDRLIAAGLKLKPSK